jgi:hypothetical protein
MGGSVFREDAGAGFAAGGAPGGDDVLAQINALVNSHQGMFPYGKAGMYGSGVGKAGPYGSTLMQAPNRNLLTAPAPRQQPPYDVRQAMRDVGDIAGMPERIQKGYAGAKAGLVGSPGQTTTTTSPSGQTTTQTTPSSGGLAGEGGRLQWQGSWGQQAVEAAREAAQDVGAAFGYAHGGGIRPGLAVGGLPYSQAEDEHVPEDVSKPMTPQSLQPAKTPQTDPNSDMKTVMEAAKIAAEDPTVAAVASDMAGQTYHLQIVTAHIQDDPHNRTRFAIIGSLETGPSGIDTTTPVLTAIGPSTTTCLTWMAPPSRKTTTTLGAFPASMTSAR